jgi:hypothetical protein
MCETLERLVCQDDDDDDDAKIQYSLRFVWLTVQEALLECPGVIERLADRDGFEAGVEPDREKSQGILAGYNRNSTSIALLTYSASLTMFCV